MNIPYYKLLLFVLLIVGCMFAYNDEPKLKKHHWKLFWIEKEVKSIVKIDFIDETEKVPNFLINNIFKKIFSFEKYFINKFSFPFGLSLLAIVKKK